MFGISLITGFLLFGSDNLIDNVGLLEFVERYRMWIGIVFLSSTAFFIVHFIIGIWDSIKQGNTRRGISKMQKERLRNLTPAEKQVLRFYFVHNTRSQNLSFMNGTVRELEHLRIIYRPSNLGRGYDMQMSYNIQPFAWDYLKKRQYLLEDNNKEIV